MNFESKRGGVSDKVSYKSCVVVLSQTRIIFNIKFFTLISVDFLLKANDVIQRTREYAINKAINWYWWIMPSLMVVQSAIKNLNNFCEEGSSNSEKPLDFTMSKFKSSSPMRHPLYQQFFGSNNNNNNNDLSVERNETSEEQGKALN